MIDAAAAAAADNDDVMMMMMMNLMHLSADNNPSLLIKSLLLRIGGDSKSASIELEMGDDIYHNITTTTTTHVLILCIAFYSSQETKPKGVAIVSIVQIIIEDNTKYPLPL